MNYANFFRGLIEFIEGYRKTVSILFLIGNDNDLLTERGHLKDDINRLNKNFENILLEQNEEYLDNIENKEESIIEKFSNK